MMQEMGVEVRTGESAATKEAAPADVPDDDEVFRMMKALEQSAAGEVPAGAIDDDEVLKMMAEVGAMANEEQTKAN